MDYFQLFNSSDQAIIIQGNNSQTSWIKLKELISEIQQHLIKNNVKSCALLSDDTTEFVVYFLACSLLGIDILLPPNGSQEMIKSLKADMYVGQFNDFNQIEPSKECLLNNPKESTITIFTSGSSGKPKRISRKLSQLLLELEEINSLDKDPKKQVLIASTVSYQHIYGLLFAIIWPLKYKHIIWDTVLPFEESLLKITSHYKYFKLISSPAFLKRLTIKNFKIQKKMSVFCSGGVLTDEQHLEAENKLNSIIIQVYGSSETGGIATKLLTSDWRFFSSVQSKIKKSLEHNANILWVKSPYCYKNEWLNTHDIVEKTDKGFNLFGRSDRIVKIEEKRISLIQVEKIILMHEMVNETHIFSISTKRQYLAAIIVLNSCGIQKLEELGEKGIKQIIKLFLRNKVESLAIPRQIRFVKELPVNTQGKLLHQQINALFE